MGTIVSSLEKNVVPRSHLWRLTFVVFALGSLSLVTQPACTSSDGSESGSDSSDDSAEDHDDTPSWGETPYVGSPLTCYWGQLLWLPDAAFVVQLRMPYSRNEGSAADSFTASGSFPMDAELVVVEGSSVREESLLDSEGCTFDTSSPSGYGVPGTWWFAQSGSVSVEATHTGEGGAHEGCEPDQEFVLTVFVSEGEVESLGGTRAAMAGGAWEGLSATFPGCPPE